MVAAVTDKVKDMQRYVERAQELERRTVKADEELRRLGSSSNGSPDKPRLFERSGTLSSTMSTPSEIVSRDGMMA